MVEDMFSPRIKEAENSYRDIEILDPMTKLVKSIKDSINEYNNIESNNLKIKILEGNREIVTLN